jgi:hypothetical protein
MLPEWCGTGTAESPRIAEASAVRPSDLVSAEAITMAAILRDTQLGITWRTTLCWS